MMELIQDLINLIRDPGKLITWGGYPGLALIIFAETGAMVFFLPGDSLLVVAGLYAAAGKLDILWLNLLLIPMAIIGDATSYFIGARSGPKIFNRPESRFFKPAHIKAAHAFYEKHGGKAIILARFMPLVRTFVPVVAGAAQMPYRRFAMFNVVGAAAWIISMTMTGYLLANWSKSAGFPIEKHIEKLIILVVFLSILPGIIEYIKAKRGAAKVAAAELEKA